MLTADGEEYNFGPINKPAVGNTAITVPMSGVWALCLTHCDDPEEYISRFRSTTVINQMKIDRRLRGIKNQKLDSVSDFLAGDIRAVIRGQSVAGSGASCFCTVSSGIS
jgi:hypothetical protein